MNAQQTRQYEMLLRVRDFGNTHQDLFPDPGVARDTLTALGVVIADLAATDTAKRSATASARSDRKEAARQLLGDLLVKASQTARVIRAREPTLPPFDAPARRTDQRLLAAARQFAKDAAPFDAAFVAHGMPLSAVADAAAAFEAILHDRGVRRADHIAARARIRELLASAFGHVRTLNVIVNNEQGDDTAIQAVWKSARRVDDPRRPRRPDAQDAPVPATDGDAQAPPSSSSSLPVETTH
jgi:hypothetical protein